jgi:hypothetical protein
MMFVVVVLRVVVECFAGVVIEEWAWNATSNPVV